MTFFGWMTERFNEHTSIIGIAFAILILGLVAGWFSRRITEDVQSVDPTDREAVAIVRTYAET